MGRVLVNVAAPWIRKESKHGVRVRRDQAREAAGHAGGKTREAPGPGARRHGLHPGHPRCRHAQTHREGLAQRQDTIGTASKAQGKLVFDLPTTDGYLVYKDVDATGWEYPLS